MIQNDSYYTISEESFAEMKEKSSKFLAFAYPFDDVEKLNDHLKILRSQHPKANHHCFAYEVGMSGDNYRAYDDGEPSGTAGKPILGQIRSHGLTNVLVVVVRYFGGTKLGASGLIQAYKEAANMALTSGNKVEKFIEKTFLLACSFEKMGILMNVLKRLDIQIVDKIFTSEFVVTIALRKSNFVEGLNQFKAAALEVSIEQVGEDTEIPWCMISEKEEIHV